MHGSDGFQYNLQRHTSSSFSKWSGLVCKFWHLERALIRDRSLFIAGGRGGGGGFGTKTRSNLAYPPFECYFTEVIPLITFDDFRDPPLHVFIFQANLSAPEPFPTPPPGEK